MAIGQAQMSVTTSAAAVSTSGGLPDFRGEGFRVLVQNTGVVTVYAGNASVTTSTYGYKLEPGDVLDWRLSRDEQLWLVAGSSTTVSVLVGLG